MGSHGHNAMVPFMWIFAILAVIALYLLINPKTRSKDGTLIIACIAVFLAMLIEKGLAFVVAGLVVNPFGRITEYLPTINELFITLGIWAIGIFIISIFYRIVISVKENTGI